MAAIGRLTKPVVAYKVLAAGRVAPSEAFPKLGRHLKPKDGLSAAVFPKDDPTQVAANTALAPAFRAGLTNPPLTCPCSG